MYDTMFDDTFRKASVAILNMKDQLKTSPQKALILIWTTKILEEEEVKEKIKIELKNLFTNTIEEHFSQGTIKLQQSEEVINCIIEETKNIAEPVLTQIEKEAGVQMILRELFDRGEMFEPHNEPPNVLDEPNENIEALYYVGGSVLKAISKTEYGKKLSKQMSLDRNNLDEVPLHIRQWILSQDRGGLKYCTMEAFSLLLQLNAHISRVFCAKYTQMVNKKAKVMANINNDKVITTIWENICKGSEVTEEEGRKSFKRMVDALINTAANGNLKQLKSDLRQEQRKKSAVSQANKGLRKQLLNVTNVK